MAQMEITLSTWENMALIKALDRCIVNNKPFYNLGIKWFIYERTCNITNRMVTYSLELYKDSDNFKIK